MAVTGCSVHPGVAAVVGSQTISQQRLDDVARSLCSANSAGGAAGSTALPSRGALQGALQVLLESTLSQQLGKKEGATADKKMLSAALAQQAQHIESLPSSRREAYRQALEDYAAGQLMLIDLGRKSLQSQGKSSVSDQQAIAEGNRLRAKYVRSIDVEVDPRYGTFTHGELRTQGGGGSLSVPASSRALDGSSSDPSAGWVAGLPAAQKCS